MVAYKCWGNVSMARGRSFAVRLGLPKEMTPIAWKTPLLMMREPFIGPRISGLTRGPWVMTVMTMMSMLSNAIVLAFASCLSLACESVNGARKGGPPWKCLYIMTMEMKCRE